MIVYYILGAIGVVVAGVAGRSAIRVLWRRVLRPKKKGQRGETKVRKILKKFSRSGARAKNDILIPNGRGTSQIDHLLVSKHGIFVIETKNYSGIVEGTENGNMWKQFFPGSYASPRHFFNPLLQNKGHVHALQKILQEHKDVPIYSLVVFPDDCAFPKLSGVVSIKGLKTVLKMLCSGDPVLNDKLVNDLIRTIENNEISGRSSRSEHNFKAGLHSSSQKEIDEFSERSADNAVRLHFPSQVHAPQVTEELSKRHLLTDIYAKLTIRGKTDSIEGFYENAKRRDDGTAVPIGGNFDYFICPYTGDRFPASESVNFYQGLWITYLNKNPELVDFMKEYGVSKLGNSYRCKKVLALYDADKNAFIESTKSSVWYQNMVKKQKRPPLNTQIHSASEKAAPNPRKHNDKEAER